MQSNCCIAVFDIGGTWFRSGVYSKSSGLALMSKVPAVNYKNTSYKQALELQLKLVDYLAGQIKYFREQHITVDAAVISMGAALNGHTGMILNSGPLWGPACKPFDLLKHLRPKMPDVDWMVINDVSAALLRHVDEPRFAQARRVSLITVSSGIACRTYDRSHRCIPLNKDGIQGEIGHIPINFSLGGQTIRKRCDCGKMNHLNAFSSGRGIANLRYSGHFFEDVNAGKQAAIDLLNAVTYPLADMIIHMLTIDSEIEKIILTGGVVHSIEKAYIRSLTANLKKIGMYQVSDPSLFFKEIITLGVDDDRSGLLGAAIAYENRTSYTI